MQQPRLFFAETLGFQYTSGVVRQVQEALVDAGWVQLPFYLTVSSARNQINSHTAIDKKNWYDADHAKSSYVVNMLVELITHSQITKESTVLVIGDSTTAYCVDRKRDTTFGALSREIEKRTGVKLQFQSISGSSFTSGQWVKEKSGDWHHTSTSFATQVINGTTDGWTYDFVLLIGGWNEEFNHWFSPEYIEREVTMLTTTCIDALSP